LGARQRDSEAATGASVAAPGDVHLRLRGHRRHPDRPYTGDRRRDRRHDDDRAYGSPVDHPAGALYHAPKPGGIEAEIGEREAQELRERAADLPAAGEPEAETSPGAPTIEELIERDPVLGLAKLRIELEQEVSAIYAMPYPLGPRRPSSLGLMIRRLRDDDALPPEIVNLLADVNGLANRAIHGDFVPQDVAEEIAHVGLRVLAALRSLRELFARERTMNLPGTAPHDPASPS
jgi:hypothetical protein